MKKHYLGLLVFLSFITVPTFAQLVGTNCYVQGRYLDIGMTPNAAFGACNAQGAIPPSYHRHTTAGAPPTGANLAETYDYGHDGWAVGAPVFMGDYTYPGSPFEGWALQVGASRAQAFQSCTIITTGTSGGGALAGSHTGYSNVAGRATGTWTGTYTGGGATLAIRQETRVDTLASAVVVTTVLRNTGPGATPPVYYQRTCDPDNDQTWPGGGFFTFNTIIHQNEDARHRVLVASRGNTGANSYMSLGTKDCRARCCIYDSWPMSSAVDLATVWNGTNPSSTHNLGGTRDNDIAISLVYNLGSIPTGDSTILSYAYIFNGNLGIDSAFPDPQIVVNGTPKLSWAPPTPNYDTFNACLYPGLTSIPVDILNATDKGWSWSRWTWSTGTGLATTTGVHNTITLTGLPPIITYTITGTDSATGMYSCHNKVFYLTILTCNQAVVNNVCVGDTLFFNAPGDSTGATYQWYGPAPSTSIVATTQAFSVFPATTAHAGLYKVIKTVLGVPDTSETTAQVWAWPVVTAASNQPLCGPIVNPLNLSCSTDSICTSWTWSGPVGFASSVQNPVINPFTPALQGVYTVNVVSAKGCPGTGTVVVKPGPNPIAGPSGVCQYFSVTLTDVTPDGTWSSSNPAIASVNSSGVVTGHLPGTVTIKYTLANGCDASATFTVWPKPAPPIVPEERHCQFQPAHVLSVTVTGPGYTTTWYGLGVTPPQPSLTNVSTIIPLTDTLPGVYNYYVTQTSPQGCVSDSAVFPVRIIDEPDAPQTHDTSYCQNDPYVAPLKATGDSLAWYTSATATPGTGIYAAPTPSVANAGITYYYVTQEIDGCESPKAPLKVTVLVLPDFEIVGDKYWVCQFDSLELRYDGPTYINPAYAWSLPDGASFVSGTGPSDQNVWIRFDIAVGKHFVNLQVSNYGGRCFTTATKEVRVIPAPSAHNYINKDICLGDSITLALTSHSSNAHTYNWWVDNTPIRTSTAIDIITSNINSGGPYLISFKDTGLHVIRVTGYTEEGCAADPRGDTVKVHNLPDPRFTVSEIPAPKFCVEDSVLFTARVKNYDYNYRWEPEHFFVNQNRPEIWGRVELNNSRVMLTVTTPFGCKASYSSTLKPDDCCNVTMPNAFTPNGDGKNDRFQPIFDGYKRFHTFRVTNRWGHTVFESANSNPSWDGTYQGVRQDIGTYYYYLKFDCGGKTHETKGDITLIR